MIRMTCQCHNSNCNLNKPSASELLVTLEPWELVAEGRVQSLRGGRFWPSCGCLMVSTWLWQRIDVVLPQLRDLWVQSGSWFHWRNQEKPNIPLTSSVHNLRIKEKCSFKEKSEKIGQNSEPTQKKHRRKKLDTIVNPPSIQLILNNLAKTWHKRDPGY